MVCCVPNRFNLTRKFAAFQFRRVRDGFTQTLVHSRDGLLIKLKVVRELVCRLSLIEALQDSNRTTQLPERLLFSTAFVSASYVAATSAIDRERTAENTLASSLSRFVRESFVSQNSTSSYVRVNPRFFIRVISE